MTGEVAEAPRRREGVELHVVSSEREGRRWVLEDTWHGRYVELRAGERDAFVWERLDGTRTLHAISREFLDAHGAFPRDLAGLLTRLSNEGLIEGGEAAPLARPTLGRLAARVPIPGLGSVLSALAVPFAPFARGPVFALLLLAGATGLGLALATHSLARVRGTLLELDGAAWRGVVAFVFLNFALSVVESIARAAVLRRGSRVSEAGLALTLGLPSIYVGEASALVLPVERRVLVHLAPLACALVGGGGAAALLQLQGASPRVLALLALLAWTGLLRALFHANPIGPSGVERAIAAWSHVEDLAAASRRFFTHDAFAPRERGFAPRERLLLLHGAASLGWLVLAARTLGRLALGEVFPRFQEALRAGDRPNAAALLVPLALAAVPLAIVLGALLLALVRALGRAIDRSPSLGSPRGASSLVAAVALLVALETVGLAPSRAAAHAALVGLLGAALAFRAPRGDGPGRAALALTAVALAVLLEMAAAALFADASSRGALREGLPLALAWMHTSARFFLLAGACLELGTASRLGAVAEPLGVLGGVAGLATLAVPVAGALGGRTAPSFVDPALSLGAALFFLTALVASSGATRAASRGWLALAALAFLLASSRPGIEQLAARGILAVPAWFPLEGAAGAALVLALGLSAAAFVARSREARTQSKGVAVDLEEDRTARAVFARILASMPFQAEKHLGRGAAEIVEARLGALSGTTEDLARRAVQAGRAVAGEAWLARFLDAACARVPSADRARLGRALAAIQALEAAGLKAQDSSGPEDAERIERFRSVPILGPLKDEDVKELALLAVRERVPLGTAIVRQGDEGDRFYVIAKGSAQVSTHGKDGRERTVAELGEGDAFGEAALLRHEPRSATVTAETPMYLLVVERDVFVEFMQARKELIERMLDRLEDVWMVRSMGIFSELDGSQVAHLFQRFKLMEALPDARIITEGEPGDRFYVVRDGTLQVERGAAPNVEKLAELRRGDYFGEMALLHDAPRAATVRAVSDVQLLALERDDFLRSFQGRGRARLEEASKKRRKGSSP